MARILGNTVAIDGGEVSLTQRLDGGEVNLANMTGGDLGTYMLVTGRTTQTIDTTENWNRRVTYIPQEGQIIVYSDYAVIDGVNVPNIKIGDGTSYVVDLPFVGDDLRIAVENHIADTGIHVTPEEKSFWNNKVTTDEIDIANERLILTKL